MGEADDQIHLGEDGVDGKADLQFVVQFGQALADGVGVRVDLGRREIENVVDADRHQHAVDRLARPVGAQHVEKGEPALSIDLGVRILRRVAPRGVDEHGLVGEPPIAIARAADALHGARRGVVGERKLQPGIDQRRRLAGAGRPDDEIPRQIVEIARARLAALLQRRERVLHFFGEDRRVGLVGDRLGHRLFKRRRGAPALDDRVGDRGEDDDPDDEDDRKAQPETLRTAARRRSK